MTTRNALALWLTLCVLLGASSLVLDGLGLALMAGIAVAAPSLWLCSRLDRPGLSLMAIFLVALALRWGVCAGINYLVYETRPGLFAPDEIRYDYSGWMYCLYLEGKIPHPWDGGAVTGVIRLTGVSYYLLGHNVMVPKMIIGVLGAWSAALTALMAARLFPAAVARRAGWLAAVFPSLVLWSSVLMKDTTSLVGAQLALLGFLMISERFSLPALVLLFLGVGVISYERPYEIIFVALAVSAGLLVQGDRRLLRNSALLVALSMALFLVIKRSGGDTAALGEGGGSIVDRVAILRAGYASANVGSAVNTQIVDTSSAGGLLLWIPIGLVYFFLAPFPFTGGSIISLATSPEMLLLYWMVPSAWRGLRAALKRRTRGFMALFFYLLISSVGWSIAITNVGTIYRYRAQILFVPLMLIAADQVRRRESGAALSASRIGT
ncbi:MAG TPA: hypothetical protein VFF06_17885 [Polyangia bacterium]|nr:hypothetical protein [Polyangia bacterium]